MRLEAVAADFLVIVFGDNPGDATYHAAVEIHEVDERFLEVEDDCAIVHDLNMIELVAEDLGVGALEVLIGPFDVGGGERCSVVELEA